MIVHQKLQIITAKKKTIIKTYFAKNVHNKLIFISSLKLAISRSYFFVTKDKDSLVKMTCCDKF